MKRLRAALLAVMMALTCCAVPTAAAEERPDYAALQAQLDALYEQIRPLEEKLGVLYEQTSTLEERLAQQYADYYERYGDMNSWDEATWALSDTWSEMEWQGYWLGMDAYWSGQFQGQEDWDWLAFHKERLGMPFPNGVNVRINGVYVQTAPIMEGGLSYLPADILLEALDLEEAELEPVELDGVSCLSIRQAAEAAGYEVAWDDYYAVIAVDNWAAVAAQIDADFTSVNAIFKAGMNTMDPAKTYESTGRVELKGTLYGEEKHDSASLTIDMDALARGDYSAFSADYTVKTDLKDFEEIVRELGGQSVLDAAQALDGRTMSLRMDGAKGGLYMKGNLWELFGMEFLPAGKWVGVEEAELGALYTQMIEQMHQNMTVGGLLTMVAKENYQPYEMLESSVKVCKLLFADDVFTVKTLGNTTTYACEQNMVTLVTRAAALGLFTAEDLGDLFGETGIPTGAFSLTAKVTGEKLTGMSLKGNVHWSVLDLELATESTGTATKTTMALKGRWLGKLEVTGSTRMVETGKRVPGAPGTFLELEDLAEKWYRGPDW